MQGIIPHSSKTDRLMARIALTIFLGGLLYGFYSLGGPVWWKFYATVIHPFEDHPPGAAALAKAPSEDIIKSVGGAGAVKPGSKLQITKPGGGKLEAKPKEQVKAKQEERPKKKVIKRNDLPKAEPKVEEKPKEKPKEEAKPAKPFNVEDYPLNRERVHALLQDGLIMITWANHHYLDFAKTWVYHMKQLGVTGYMVGAMDDDMLRDLATHDVNTWRMNTGIVKHDLGWGSQNFHKMGRAKIKLIKDFLDLEVAVVISDIDTAWVKNPLPYFARFPEADILTSTDQLMPTVETDELERYPDAGASFNIGIMLFRQSSKEFVEDWVKVLDDPQVWDQTAFNDLARRGSGHSDPTKRNLFKAYNGKLTMGVLPCALFASGHTFFVQRKYEEFKLEPYVAHATFQYSGTPGKRNRFREFMLFDDPPSYYDHEIGFVTIEMDVPKHMLEKAAEPMIGAMTPEKLQTHFELVHHQLFQLRSALAVAQVTGRVIVLPPIWCQLDKYWAPLFDGNIPGSKWKKPFICPADHVLDLEGGWQQEHRPAEHWGPYIDWREYSFLQNPRMTKAVNDSRLTIEVCASEDEAGCHETGSMDAVKDGVIRVKPNRLASQIRAGMPGGAQAKVLVLRGNVKGFFRGFDTLKAQELWEKKLGHMTSVNCCLNTSPGWVWYDFFADRAHKDRFGRQFNGTWVVKRGDANIPGRRNLLSMPRMLMGNDPEQQQLGMQLLQQMSAEAML